MVSVVVSELVCVLSYYCHCDVMGISWYFIVLPSSKGDTGGHFGALFPLR